MSRRWVGSLVLVFCCLFLFKGLVDEVRHVHAQDFQPVYSGSRCLLERCNPYEYQDLDRVFREAGGVTPSFRQGSANYPPTTFFAVLPIALLPWPAAHILWLALIGISMSLAILLAVDLAQTHAAIVAIACGMFLITQRWLLSSGQPSGVAIGFCVIAVWCLLNNKYGPLAVILFAFSLAIKPQIASLIWLYFVLSAPYRRRALQILATLFLVGFPGVLWASLTPASHHWFHEEASVVRYIAQRSDQVQGVLFCQCTHLQPLLGHFPGTATIAQAITWGTWAILLVWWLDNVYRLAPSREKDILCIASAACLTLIPLYHGEYDTCLLFLLFPASAHLLATRRRTGLAALLSGLLILALYLVRTFAFRTNGLAGNPQHPHADSIVFDSIAVILILLVVLLHRSMASSRRSERLLKPPPHTSIQHRHTPYTESINLPANPA